VLSGEATNINFIVFGLTRPVLEPTIYRTRGEHANHYTTDAVTILDGVQTILIYVGTGITQRLFGSNWSKEKELRLVGPESE
jgi:hypothetical protein